MSNLHTTTESKKIYGSTLKETSHPQLASGCGTATSPVTSPMVGSASICSLRIAATVSPTSVAPPLQREVRVLRSQVVEVTGGGTHLARESGGTLCCALHEV